MRLIALVVVLGACAEDPRQLALDSARSMFASVGDYSVVARSGRAESDDEVRLVVVDEHITDATFVASGTTVPMSQVTVFSTVERQFEEIQDAIDLDATLIDVTYDPALGYPTRLEVTLYPDDIWTNLELKRDLAPLP